MNPEIENRFTGNVIVEADKKYASIKEAVEKIIKTFPRPTSPRAILSRANLYGARGINPYQSTPLLMLYDQPENIRAYKLVNQKNEGPYNGGIIYKIGETYEVKNANTDVTEQCGAGINLATLDWCMKEWKKGYKILIAEFTAKDIACIPTATDGKFRVSKCTIVGKKTLREVGLGRKK